MYIVGVGPGAPDLVTLRAVRALERAEVVVYGNLVPDEIIEKFCKNAREVIKVTKRHRRESIRIVVEKALEGKIVAHLKNGDPAIFSSLREEIEELRRCGIPFEIIPGVSSVSASILELGLSLTDYASGVRGFSVVDGHDEDPRVMSELLRMLGMIVVLMPSIEKVREMLRYIDGEYCVIAVKRATLEGRTVYINDLPDESSGPTIVYVTTDKTYCERACRE